MQVETWLIFIFILLSVLTYNFRKEDGKRVEISTGDYKNYLNLIEQDSIILKLSGFDNIEAFLDSLRGRHEFGNDNPIPCRKGITPQSIIKIFLELDDLYIVSIQPDPNSRLTLFEGKTYTAPVDIVFNRQLFIQFAKSIYNYALSRRFESEPCIHVVTINISKDMSAAEFAPKFQLVERYFYKSLSGITVN